ncbi:MAG TPA: gluconokinase [Chloroflexota bacterium]|nr:gluconokinase [Chloroflexota bacterium]
MSPKRAEPPLVLSIDVGTTSVRAILFDRKARDVRGVAASAETPLETTPGGGATIDTEQLLELTLGAIDEALAIAKEELRPHSEFDGVAISTFWHSFVGVDDRNQPTTPLLVWADSRARQEMLDLRKRLDERAVHARTGCLLHWSYWPAKLLWLRKAMPEAYARTARWVSFGELFHLRVLDRAVCGVSMASGTGLLDQNAQQWDAEMLATLDLDPARLLPLTGQGEVVGKLRPEFAKRWPMLRDTRWFPSVGDGAVSNVGSGCATQDRMALMVGTSAALRVAWRGERTEIPWGAWCYRIDENRFVLGCADSNGGNLFQWLDETLRLPASRTTERALRSMTSDAHGLTVLPFIAGERGPGYAAHARAAVLGLSQSTRPIEILRASLEAVALRFALMYGIVTSVLPEPKQAVATGGGLQQSPAWAQIVADAIGRPLVASGEREASSRGAALLALERLGAIENVETTPAALKGTYEPDDESHARLMAAQKRHRHYYQRLVADEQPTHS